MSEPKPTDYYQGQSVSDFIMLHAMPWHLANVVKYLTRWWAKDDMTALYKARDYLDTFIKRCETQPATKAFIVAGIKATIELRRRAEAKEVQDEPEPVATSTPKPGSREEFDSLVPGDWIGINGGEASRKKITGRTGELMEFEYEDYLGRRQTGTMGLTWYDRYQYHKIDPPAPPTKPTPEPGSAEEFDSLVVGDEIEKDGSKGEITKVNRDGETVIAKFPTGYAFLYTKHEWSRYGCRKVVRNACPLRQPQTGRHHH